MAEKQPSETEHPMARICDEWLRKIEIAKKVKNDLFGQYAKECARFYDSSHDFMWQDEYATSAGGFLDKEANRHMPVFRMTVNKPFEAVALFGPALMHRYPAVTVTPTNPPTLPPEAFGLDLNDPQAAMMYQQYTQEEGLSQSQRATTAALFQHYLNWLQLETSKKTHARLAITEAIVKGLGILWTELHAPRGSSIRYPRSVFVSCDDIQKDPDAEYAENVMWIARYNVHPVNLVAQKFGLNEKDLKGALQSYEAQGTAKGKREARSKKSPMTSTSYDLLPYWEIYSKNGFGHRLKAVGKSQQKSKYDFDLLGDYCYLAVAKNIPYPLNLPTKALTEDMDSILQRTSWPIPFWTDEGSGNGWPFTELHFYDKMNSVWPISLIKPAIGELRFVNWCMSFLADKVAASCTTYVGIAKAAGIEIQNQLQSGLAPFTVIEISEMLGKNVQELVSFLQAPSFAIDIWKMLSEVLNLIDKRTGLTELVYGLSGVQLRSAAESEIKNSNVSIRPDDMAERTEDFYSQTVMKEAEALTWACTAQDVAGPLGGAGASYFEQNIQTQQFETVVRDYSYRIESGSARKPNKINRQRTLNEWGQVALPVLQQFAMQGITAPWNAYVAEVGKAMDFDASPFMVEMPQPQPSQGPSKDEVKAQEKQQELQWKEISFRQELAQDEDRHEQEMKQLKERGDAE